MQLAEPHRFEIDEGFNLSIQCPASSFFSVSSNSSSPLNFDGSYQSFQNTPTPPSVVMHKYMFGPVKAEHERMYFSSSDGSLSPSTFRKLSDIMPYDHMLDVNNINTHYMGPISPPGPLPVYTEAPLQSAPYTMTPTPSVSPSGMADNAFAWSCNNDSPISFFRPKEQSPQNVEPLNLQRYSELPLWRYYQHGLPVSAHMLPSQRQAMFREARIRTTELHREIQTPIKVPEQNDGSYDVVRKAMYKCDYPNCHKAFKRNEHLKRHKQTFHGEGPNRFSCEFCGKDQFNRQDNLNIHRKLHARPKSRNRGVEFIAAAVPLIEQEERSRKRRAPPSQDSLEQECQQLRSVQAAIDDIAILAHSRHGFRRHLEPIPYNLIYPPVGQATPDRRRCVGNDLDDDGLVRWPARRAVIR